ncbi:MAG: thioredoxin domain-containing protein [Bacillota bacterium]|nr:thioredoxin domain-containing protein [Bacillota bacterium]
MKIKRYLISLLVLLVLPLTSCGNKDKTVGLSNLLISERVEGESYLIPTTDRRIEALLNGGDDFALYFASQYCPHCTKVNPVMDNYAKENNIVINYFNMSGSLDYMLSSGMLDIFSNGYPSLYLISNGLIKESYIGSNKLDTNKKIELIFDRYTYKSNFTYVYSLDEIDELTSSEITLVFINGESENQVSNFTQYIRETLKKCKKDIYFVDLSYDFEITQEELLTRLGIENLELQAVRYKEKSIISNSQYNSDEKDAFIDFIINN